MRNPINLQIQRADRYWSIVEVAPVLIEQENDLVNTGFYDLYEGYPENDSELYNAAELRDKYLANLELTGKDHPGFLGELHFTGLEFFEWKYNGTQLIEFEVLQIVDCIQDYACAHSLNFNFSRNQVVDQIRIEKYKGYYKIFINDVYTAQIEWLQEEWIITSGSIGEPDLRAEVIKRINANSG